MNFSAIASAYAASDQDLVLQISRSGGTYSPVERPLPPPPRTSRIEHVFIVRDGQSCCSDDRDYSSLVSKFIV